MVTEQTALSAKDLRSAIKIKLVKTKKMDMKCKKDANRFLAALNEEKITSQKRRGELISKKLTWVTGLFALGAIKLPLAEETHYLLFFVPIISLVFDLYIIGENYVIKRMGCFVRLAMSETYEGEWESWLFPRRDIFSRNALLLSSAIILIASAVVLWWLQTEIITLSVWLFILILSLVLVSVNAYRHLLALDKMTYSDFLKEFEEDKRHLTIEDTSVDNKCRTEKF